LIIYEGTEILDGNIVKQKSGRDRGGYFMRKKLLIRAAVVLGVCLATLLMAAPAMAIWDWCDVDPILTIGGHSVSLDAAYLGDSQDINGKITFVVTVPRGTPVSIDAVDPGVKVKVRYDGDSSNGIPVGVSVSIKSKQTYDTTLTVTLEGTQLTVETGNTDDTLGYSFII